MPPRRKKVFGGGRKKKKISPEPVVDIQVVEKVYLDPWCSIRSPYGGKLSPSDNWTRLTAEYVEKRVCTVYEKHFAVAIAIGGEAPPSVDAAIEMVLAEEEVARLAVVATETGCATTTAANTTTTIATDTTRLQIAPPKSIDTLHLLNCHHPPMKVTAEILSRLVALSISSCQLNDANVGQLLENDGHPVFLRSLALENNDLTTIPIRLPPKLTSLNVAFNKITSIGARLNPCKSFLYFLSLEANNLKDDVFKDLYDLLHLRVLDVSANPRMTTVDLPTLPLSQSLKQLEELSLGQTFLGEELGAVLKQMIALKRLNGKIFSQSMCVDIVALSDLQHQIVADDENIKDSATCSCVEGNPCISRYNCHVNIWYRRHEVARLAREDPNFTREDFLSA